MGDHVLPAQGPGPAADTADAGHELAKGEGLDYIVVRPGVKALYPVIKLSHGGKEYHRDGGPLAPCVLQYAEPVRPRQHTVQDDQVIAAAGHIV